MAEYGILIDYEFCTNCHGCEIACKREKSIPEGKWGIKVYEVGPWEFEDERWQLKYLPVPTDLCDLFAERTEEGKLPACVHSCFTGCMEYGTVEELSAKLAERPSRVLFNKPSAR